MEIDLSIKTSFQLQMRWRDHRLNFLNLRDDYLGNLISENEGKKLWTPPLQFETAKHGTDRTIAYDELTTLAAMKQTEAEMSGLSILHETKISSGAANSLIFIKTFDMDQSCDFQLGLYPFDTQNCRIKVSTD